MNKSELIKKHRLVLLDLCYKIYLNRSIEDDGKNHWLGAFDVISFEEIRNEIKSVSYGNKNLIFKPINIYYEDSTETIFRKLEKAISEAGKNGLISF